MSVMGFRVKEFPTKINIGPTLPQFYLYLQYIVTPWCKEQTNSQTNGLTPSQFAALPVAENLLPACWCQLEGNLLGESKRREKWRDVAWRETCEKMWRKGREVSTVWCHCFACYNGNKTSISNSSLSLLDLRFQVLHFIPVPPDRMFRHKRRMSVSFLPPCHYVLA
jgi:hypothetical protein